MAQDKELPYKLFKLGDISGRNAAEKETGVKGGEDSFKQLYGPRVAAVEERLKKLGEVGGAHRQAGPEERAREILEAAEAEAREIREKARKEGLENGLAEGRLKLAQATERLSRVATELAAVKPRLIDEAHEEVVNLVCAIAERIMGPLICEKPECVVSVVTKALGALSQRETITLRVNPADLQLLMEAKQDVLESVDGVRNLTIVDDPSVGQGGCIVDTGSTEIDARVKTQLDEIVRALGAPK